LSRTTFISARKLAFALVLLSAICISSGISANRGIRNTSKSAVDTTSADSTNKKPKIDDPVFATSEDSITYNIKDKKVSLYGKGNIKYQTSELKANFIELNTTNKVVFAKGTPDSTGRLAGKPEFKDGSESFKMETIYYNFDTKKAKITNIVTKQEDGYLHSTVSKKLPDNSFNIANGKYTTCDHEHPHFYINVSKARVIPGKKIIVGPSNLVIEDVPLPLFIPFGFFPINSGRASGFLLPTFGEEKTRGFYIGDAGYYIGLNDYWDLELRGSIYTLGSWEAKANTRYTKKYRYNGSFNFRVMHNVIGDKGSTDYYKSNDFSINWSHSQDPKAHPGTTLSASVNFSTSGSRYFGYQNPQQNLATSASSSISYAKSWKDKPYNLSIGLTHSQNNTDSVYTFGLPSLSFNVNRIQPFQRKNNTDGKVRWYERFAFSYSGELNNQLTIKEKDLFNGNFNNKFKNGIRHTIPFSYNFNLFNYLNFSPNATYNERWYLSTISKKWNNSAKRLEVDTIKGFKRAYDYNFGVGTSTTLYGMFIFKKGSAIQAIRHKMTPSISYSYTPDFSNPKYGYFKTVQTDTLGRIQKYSIFEQGIYGGPTSGNSSALSFSLGNNLEMKVRSKKDTVTGYKKIKILESFSLSSSYNFIADSMKLSNISFNGNTNLFEKLSVSFGGSLSPYALTKNGQLTKEYLFDKEKKLARLTNFTLSLDWSLAGAKPNNMNTANASTNPIISQHSMESGMPAYIPYANFDVPWDLRFSYSFNYSKPGLNSTTSQIFNVSGNVKLTKKWAVNATSGYDFSMNKLSFTQIGITRDLHCWNMNFSWIPIGQFQSWNFSIRVTSSMLGDALKYKKNESYIDRQYGY
jgi:lipopolysaccharide assembly outer membrane protein LptD (OstA)